MPLSVISPSISTASPSRCERAGEPDDRVALGVEELGGEQVRLEVLLLDLDALDARRAGELAVGERPGVEVGDPAAERRDRVKDLEGDAGVDGARPGTAVGTSVCVSAVVVLIAVPPLILDYASTLAR